METKKFETYCNCNLTNLLIKSGFNWQNYFVAHSIDENFHWEIPLHIAQRWLREVKNIHIEIIVGDHSGDWGYYLITDIHKPDNMPIINGVPKMSKFYDGFKSYEESQEAGIKKACEIILSKK